jgi:glycine/D-amino acid oxidase-like deaminating enzyme
MSKGPQIAVVGAGIIGSAISLELSRRGAAVTLIDAGGERASENSFGWINASWFNRPYYFQLRHFSMAVWRQWAGRVPGLEPHWPGGLLWDLEGAALEAYARDYAALGAPLKLIGRDAIRQIEPDLMNPPEQAVLAEAEGFVDAAAAATALRKAALAAGARLMPGKVTEVTEGALRLAEGQRITADTIIVAAGVGVPGLLDLPVDPVPGLMARTTPARTRLNHILAPPELLLLQDPQGRILCGGEAGGSAVDDDPQAIAQGVVDRVAALLGEAGLSVAQIIIGHRPTPTDGHPIIGRMPGMAGVHVAAMHSGVTLAPGVAQLMADEVLDGARAPLLAPFRPERFTG